MARRKSTRKIAAGPAGGRNGAQDRTAPAAVDSRKLRQQLRARVNVLSDERLRVADDFLAYLIERESQAATDELLSIPGFLSEFRAASVEAKKGRAVEWRTVRDDV